MKDEKMTTNEQITFKLINMQCCGFQACWINPRLPNYCPECGQRAYPYVKGWVTSSDENAWLRVGDEASAHAAAVGPRSA